MIYRCKCGAVFDDIKAWWHHLDQAKDIQHKKYPAVVIGGIKKRLSDDLE